MVLENLNARNFGLINRRREIRLIVDRRYSPARRRPLQPADVTVQQHPLLAAAAAPRSIVNSQIEKIKVVDSFDDWEEVADEFKKSCELHPFLGLDCEWVTENGIRRPIALLQIANHNGVCALIRLFKLKVVPSSLLTILRDEEIVKFGVGISKDAQFIMNDYNIQLCGCVELGLIAKKHGVYENSLGALAQKTLGVVLDKDWRVRASYWEAETLSERQIEYAAMDAFVALRIFEQLIYPSYPSVRTNLASKSVSDSIPAVTSSVIKCMGCGLNAKKGLSPDFHLCWLCLYKLAKGEQILKV
ncbi:exonuclease 3'-5' domain-containing protein 2-like [Adelges cooleyi]|uniref:exonuclease 3'-5' domain-containing protein 2-like n=1 Tax=Adelges cooleyi TaxID=133065 RepID=UPI00217F43AF|nr:exonuclease 3'-5' domain-containing protein 2-like [Adelges cooleyi]